MARVAIQAMVAELRAQAEASDGAGSSCSASDTSEPDGELVARITARMHEPVCPGSSATLLQVRMIAHMPA